MFRILSITLIIVISPFRSNHAFASPQRGFHENDLNFVSSELNLNVFKSIDPNIEEDSKLRTPELIKKYGYEVEVHNVITEDGYKLELHRIPGGPKSPPRKGKKVCLTVHGLLDSSATYVLSGPHHGLGYLLADNDFDVWLINTRGNTYSTNHTSYKPFGSFFDRNRFWEFSWHEIGIYDLPATIDYILRQTRQSTLQYVGHSQGATAFFVMLSEKPEYNDKIDMMQALAPAVFMSHVSSPPIRAIAPILPLVQRVRALLGVNYFQPNEKFLAMAGKMLCRDSAPTQAICENFLFLLLGYNTDQLNSTLLPVIVAHAPAGSSTNQMIHFGQGVNTGRFRQYDYGFPQNWLKYRQFSPPEYNLKNVRVPVAIYYSQNDWMAGPKDIHTLLQKLPYVIKSYFVPHKAFNHMDFLWGVDAPILVFDEVIDTIKSSYIYSKRKLNDVEQNTGDSS